MNSILRAILLVTLVCTLINTDTSAQEQKHHRIAFQASPIQLKELQYAGLALDHYAKIGQEIQVDLSETEIAILASIIPSYQVLIPDLSSYYVNRNKQPLSNSYYASTPANFTLGSMGGFLTYTEIQAQLDSMHAKYPSLVSSKFSIGQSLEGRNIYCLKISDDVSKNDSTEAELLYDAMHHAREPEAMMQLIYFMWHILEKYEQGDTRAQFILNNRQLYFIPIVNPDGYVYNQSIAPDGGGMWRKNRKDNGDGSFGVDLNRNYGKDWGYDDFGSSPSTTSNTYRGTAAFSEPETQVMRAFVNSRRFKSNFSYHSYGEYLIYPYGSRENYYTSDSFLFRTYADSLTRVNDYFSGTVFETLSYFANGGSCDWMYAGQNEHGKIMSFTPEVGNQEDGFWPLSARIIPIAEDNIEANYFLAERCLQEIRRQIPKRVAVNSSQGQVFVKFISDGYPDSLQLNASLEFLAGNSKFESDNDVLNLQVLPSFESRSKAFGFKVNVSVKDSSLARIKTELNGKTYLDTIQVVFDPNLVGISQIAKNEIKIYPNPSKGAVKIICPGATVEKIEIFGSSAKLIDSYAIDEEVNLLELNLPAGIYILKITQKDLSTSFKKLVIQP